jgi:uncharacterized protein (DUF433 family)
MAVEREGTPESATLKGRITKRSDVCGGDACIRDTRITVWGLVEWWKLGLSDSEILERVQGLKPDDLDTARAYYAEHPEEIDEAIRQNEEA